MSSAVLLITCPDRKGLVAGIANFLLERGANILHADQHQDAELGLFLMRVEFALEGLSTPIERFASEFEPTAKKFEMRWKLNLREQKPKVVIFTSKYDHCLSDLLYRHGTGELHCDVTGIVSNHPETEALAEFHGVPFHYVPVTPETKAKAEAQQLALSAGADLIVLARYMQILSPEFVKKFENRIINIHHSFLPAFTGAKPYHRAFERGVKLIGATSHYVTAVLDDGPIIEQDVSRVSHRSALEDLLQKGRDLEKIVLSRAVRWHLESRILVYSNKTVVFD